MSRLPKSRQRTRRSHSGASQPTLPARRVNQGGPARRADNDRSGTTITITSSDSSHPHTTVAPHSADDPDRSAAAWQLCEAGVSTLPQHGPKAAVCRCLADCPNLAILRRGTEPRRAQDCPAPPWWWLQEQPIFARRPAVSISNVIRRSLVCAPGPAEPFLSEP